MTRRADDVTYALASNASATGAAVPVKGGQYAFTVDGTAGTSTLSLQVQAPTGNWMDVQWWGAAVKTTTLPYALSGVTLPAGNYRMAATGGAPSGLNASLLGLG